MIVPIFSFNAEANGYLSEPFQVNGQVQVVMELSSRAPVVILKKEKDGDFANYGQSPKQDTGMKFNIRSKSEITVILATPVEVTKCYVLEKL